MQPGTSVDETAVTNVRDRSAEGDDEEQAIKAGAAKQLHSSMYRQRLVAFASLAFANVVCQAIFSVLPAFFPPIALAKGMSLFVLGISFAALPAVVFLVSTVADKVLQLYGRRRVFIVGNLLVALFTCLLGAAEAMPDGWPFILYCLSMQVAQGFGIALAETASYALIAELFPERITFFVGLNEAFTGIGVAIGPPIGGVLFSIGGFAAPFVVLAAALLPSVMFVSYAFAVTTDRHDSDEDDESDDEGGSVSVLTLLCLPPVAMVVLACVLAEAALTFVMPTFAEHATSTGLASSPAAIGAFFAANAITYTIAAPTVGYLTSKHNARGAHGFDCMCMCMHLAASQAGSHACVVCCVSSRSLPAHPPACSPSFPLALLPTRHTT